MDQNNKSLINRLDFIEFKQNIIFLKPPQHSTQLFYDLKLEDFLKIRDFTKEYSLIIESDNPTSLGDFEKKLINIWKPAKSYPLSASLIARILMEKNLYDKLIN